VPAEKTAKADAARQSEVGKLGVAVRPLTEDERKQIETDADCWSSRPTGPPRAACRSAT